MFPLTEVTSATSFLGLFDLVNVSCVNESFRQRFVWELVFPITCPSLNIPVLVTYGPLSLSFSDPEPVSHVDLLSYYWKKKKKFPAYYL